MLPARIGPGPTPFLASYAARCAARPSLVVRGPGGFLGPLPLSFAEPTAEREGILRGWSIATLGALTALPKAEVGRRMGADGVLLWERAAGEATRVLRHVEPAVSFAAQWTYEPPVESIEPLFFKLRRYAERVALELRGAGFVAEKLSLTLLLEDGSDHRREFRLPEPGADVEGWLRVLNSHLADVRTDERVSGVRLVAAPARPPQKQEGLFGHGPAQPASFWENLARVAAIVGDDRVQDARTRRQPPPGRLHDGEARRVRDAARRAAGAPGVRACGGSGRRGPCASPASRSAPSRLEAGRLEGRVRAALRPWRSAGDWWGPAAWDVETWQVELAEGGLYQLARTGDGYGSSRGCWTSRGCPAMYVELHARSAFSWMRAQAPCRRRWLPRRRRLSACRPSRSATGTASTRPCGCTWPGRRRACVRSSGASSPWRGRLPSSPSS